jgi:hypothetical protein
MDARGRPVQQRRAQGLKPVAGEIEIDDGERDCNQYRAGQAGHQTQKEPDPPRAVGMRHLLDRQIPEHHDLTVYIERGVRAAGEQLDQYVGIFRRGP